MKHSILGLGSKVSTRVSDEGYMKENSEDSRGDILEKTGGGRLFSISKDFGEKFTELVGLVVLCIWA